MSYLRLLRALMSLGPLSRPRGRHVRDRLRRAMSLAPITPPRPDYDGLDDLRAELAPLVRELLSVRAEVAR